MKNNHIEILNNDIIWNVGNKNLKELPDTDIEHIEYMIKEGYSQGELNVSFQSKNNRTVETTGWWEIVNWQNIALDLYNAIKGNDKLLTEKAIKVFNENWD